MVTTSLVGSSGSLLFITKDMVTCKVKKFCKSVAKILAFYFTTLAKL